MHLVSCHLWLLVLVRFRLSMRVVQVDWDNLLGNRVLKGTCAFISLTPSEVETIADIIVTGRRLSCPLCECLRWHHGALLLRNEGRLAAVFVSLDRLRTILSHTGVRLLEVDVHSDRLHVVERILLIEWQAKVSFVLHFRASYMLLDGLRSVLPGANINTWITCEHVSILNEPLLLRCKVLIKLLAVQSDHLSHL